VRVRWMDGVEDVLDPSLADDQRDPAEQASPAGTEGRQVERRGEQETNVGEQWERQVEPIDGLELVRRALTGQAVDRGGAGLEQGVVVVAEVAGLRRAAAGAGDRVSSVRQSHPGPARHRVEVEHRSRPGQTVQLNAAAVRGG